jgi:acyl-CoA thioesterase-1
MPLKDHEITDIRRALFGALILILTACGGCASTAPAQASQPRLLSNIVVFMGDSIIQRWNVRSYDKSPFVNVGVTGEDTGQMLARFQTDVIAYSPGVVVILGGTNDFARFGHATIDNIKAMAKLATAAGIRVILCAVPPASLNGPNLNTSKIEIFDQELATLAGASGYRYADYFHAMLLPDGSQDLTLFVDGEHPNGAGYAKMWAVLKPLIAEDMK